MMKNIQSTHFTQTIPSGTFHGGEQTIPSGTFHGGDLFF